MQYNFKKQNKNSYNEHQRIQNYVCKIQFCLRLITFWIKFVSQLVNLKSSLSILKTIKFTTLIIYDY